MAFPNSEHLTEVDPKELQGDALLDYIQKTGESFDSLTQAQIDARIDEWCSVHLLNPNNEWSLY